MPTTRDWQRNREMWIHETMPLQVSLTAPDEVDAEVVSWLKQAYAENTR